MINIIKNWLSKGEYIINLRKRIIELESENKVLQYHKDNHTKWRDYWREKDYFEYNKLQRAAKGMEEDYNRLAFAIKLAKAEKKVNLHLKLIAAIKNNAI